jgi:KH domain-containing protein
MKKIIAEDFGSILNKKKKLEKVLKVQINGRGKEIFVEGDPFDEYEAEKVIEAMEAGFSVDTALLIKTKELAFETFNIKSFTKRKDLKSIRSRIIGKEGATLRTLTQLADCFIEIKNNDVAIIGYPEEIKTTQDAIINLIKGSKQSNVYKFLEKRQPKPILDLGLKGSKNKKRKDSEE